jgi:hypothetical protein
MAAEGAMQLVLHVLLRRGQLLPEIIPALRRRCHDD